MAGNNQTQLTQSELEDVAKKHNDVAQQVGQTQNKLRGDIQTLTSSNHGDMMKALEHVHENWQKTCSDIVKNLESMAQSVRKAGEHYGEQDQQQSQNVKKIEPSQLNSFMGG